MLSIRCQPVCTATAASCSSVTCSNTWLYRLMPVSSLYFRTPLHDVVGQTEGCRLVAHGLDLGVAQLGEFGACCHELAAELETADGAWCGWPACEEYARVPWLLDPSTGPDSGQGSRGAGETGRGGAGGTRGDGDSGAFWRSGDCWVEGNGEREGEAAGAIVARSMEGAGAMS